MFAPSGWRASYGGKIILAVILALATFCMPESPRWLASKERLAELHTVLAK